MGLELIASELVYNLHGIVSFPVSGIKILGVPVAFEDADLI